MQNAIAGQNGQAGTERGCDRWQAKREENQERRHWGNQVIKEERNTVDRSFIHSFICSSGQVESS